MPASDEPGKRMIARVLTIAGSDSGGGAGIQADIKVITCLGGYAMSAITALTAQDTRGVWGIHPVPPEFVAQQIELCLTDIGADAAKTGMLCNAEIVHAVADVLRKRPIAHLVVDPVLFSKSGHRLLDEGAEAALVSEILPLAEVVTPNLPEAARLAGVEITDMDGMRRAAEAIVQFGPRAVLVKGGHLRDDAVDLLYEGGEFTELLAARVDTKNTHGTGCCFSAALATELAAGRPLRAAAESAKKFITEAIRHSLPLGSGCGPVNPLVGLRIGDCASCNPQQPTRPSRPCRSGGTWHTREGA